MSEDETKQKAKSSKRGGFKALRVARRKAYYASRPMFTLANKKRTLAKHIRHFPEDEQAKNIFIKLYKESALLEHLKHIVSKARWRLKPRRQKSNKPVKESKHVQ
jgi:hypothetical protein